MFVRIIGFCLLLITCGAHSSQELVIPSELKNWVPWVLQGEEQRDCPFQYNNAQVPLCAWPSALHLDLDSEGGYFQQAWEVHQASWLPLPGNHQYWPQAVTVNTHAVVVSDRAGTPHIHLEKGRYRLKGKFEWRELPNAIPLPKSSGLVKLILNDKKVPFPHFEADGRLWLNNTASNNTLTVEDRFELEVSRRIIDEIPLRVITRLDLKVMGQAREIVLGPIFSDEFIALSARGLLPMRLEQDGQLRVQVRPGNWLLEVEARHESVVEQLSPIASNLPDTEIWVFDARPSLRLVEVSGVASVDPRQTRLANDWQHLPSYRVTKDDTLQLTTKRRGDPTPSANSLTLHRQLWLDFDGGGYTFQDQISGQMHQQWRLNMSPEMKLGRAAVNGEGQLITYLDNSAEQGVELRQGAISLQAEGRYTGDISTLPAIGWQDNVTQASATLNLPPGWRLVSASGADSVGGASWIDRWSLLDLFLVLIAALAIQRMFGLRWGGIALACFALSWHESGAPQYLWLLVIVATALQLAAPAGRLQRSMQALRYFSLLLLLIVALPFLVDSVRTAIHPQLEQPRQLAYSSSIKHDQVAESFAEPRAMFSSSASDGIRKKMSKSIDNVQAERYQYGQQVDPNAKVQTGPGLPEWNWSSVPIRWDGPVQQGQQLELTLLPPSITATMKFIYVILLLLLGLRLAGVTFVGRKVRLGGNSLAMILMLITAPLLLPQPSYAADIPSPALLKELKKRLLAPAECLPQCAQISKMKLEIQPDFMRILLEVHANEDVAIPIPSSIDGWLPSQVALNGKNHQALRGTGKALWVFIPKGRQKIQLSGPLAAVRLFQLPLPLKPQHIELHNSGWQVKGIHQDGTIEQALQLERQLSEQQQADNKILEQRQLPAFVTVTRTLRLGLEWQVETVLERTSPPGRVIALEIPLIDGEAVTTEGIRVESGRAIIQFAADQQQLRWRSQLTQTPNLTLRASDTLDWVERWRLNVSPLWHAQLEGIAQIHHQNRQGAWYPQWQPWPGEQLMIQLTRPTGVEGKTKTIDYSHLLVMPGERATDYTLNIRLRSSQAEQHIITLPRDATLTRTELNGLSQPLRLEAGGILRLPIVPGKQQITVGWQSTQGISSHFVTPKIDLGLESVNSNIEIRVPESRWTLFTFGPQMGPAVLFWGVLLVLMMIAIGLGRTQHTPLKTHHWLLLAIGLSQTLIVVAILVVGWLFAMHWRERHGNSLSPSRFNLLQLGVGLLTVVAVLGLVGAVGFGLLGHPDMQISGNHSSAYVLKWYADHVNNLLPIASTISVPMWIYRIMMLAWSLWLAFALLSWLKWSWQCFLTDGLWQAVPKKPKKAKNTPPTQIASELSQENKALPGNDTSNE